MRSTSRDLPLFPEAFVGWRSWRIEGGNLFSLTSRHPWPVGRELKAKCDMDGYCNSQKLVPNERCSCGIYALDSLLKLKRSQYFSYDCFGTVSLWGKVIEAEDGYRAEFAYPKVIYLPYMKLKMVEKLSVYGVPVKLLNPYKNQVKRK